MQAFVIINVDKCWVMLMMLSNVDKCKCECKELTDEGVCDKGSISNPTNCKCKCDKSSMFVST